MGSLRCALMQVGSTKNVAATFFEVKRAVIVLGGKRGTPEHHTWVRVGAGWGGGSSPANSDLQKAYTKRTYRSFPNKEQNDLSTNRSLCGPQLHLG